MTGHFPRRALSEAPVVHHLAHRYAAYDAMATFCLQVSTVSPNTEAFKSGLRVGDAVIAIDQTRTSGLKYCPLLPRTIHVSPSVRTVFTARSPTSYRAGKTAHRCSRTATCGNVFVLASVL